MKTMLAFDLAATQDAIAIISKARREAIGDLGITTVGYSILARAGRRLEREVYEYLTGTARS